MLHILVHQLFELVITTFLNKSSRLFLENLEPLPCTFYRGDNLSCNFLVRSLMMISLSKRRLKRLTIPRSKNLSNLLSVTQLLKDLFIHK
jgi:hypothetical protein